MDIKLENQHTPPWRAPLLIEGNKAFAAGVPSRWTGSKPSRPISFLIAGIKAFAAGVLSIEGSQAPSNFQSAQSRFPSIKRGGPAAAGPGCVGGAARPGCVLALQAGLMESSRVKLWYDPGLRRLARELRNHSTVSEVLLWQELKGRQRGGFDFHRQKPVGRYILDFFSSDLMLAVEIDGCSHKLKGPEDDARQSVLENLGIRFLRFHDREVRRNLDGVVLAIDGWIAANRPKD